MKIVKKGLIALVIIIFLIVAGVLTVGRTFVLNKLADRLELQLQKLRDAGYVVHYDSITIDWKQNTVEIHRLSVKNDIDSVVCQRTDFITAKYIKAEGFKVMPLILKQHLRFGTIVVDSPVVVINERFLRPDSVKRKSKEFTFMVDRIKLPSIHLKIYDAKTCEEASRYSANANIDNFKLAFYEDRPMFVDVEKFSADSINIRLPQEFYTITVNEVTFKPSMGIFDLDTLRILPHYGKIAFGRKRGYETDRIEGTIPYLNLYGLKLDRKDSMVISASKATTQVALKIFRDKRLPFKKKFKPLPVPALQQLSVGIKIDSVILNKSLVEYEEFAEGADSSGTVYFDQMYATIHNINNTDPDRKGKMDLIAQARFMGQGVVKVHASCPEDSKRKERIWGTVENLDMKRLNMMIEPAIQVSAESGHLNKMSFNFVCAGDRADGELELNYKNLRLVTYKNEKRIERILKRKKRKGDDDEDDEKVKKAAFKTFVVNTFIIRKDMDKDVPEEKRQGEIAFERDRNKSVFNFWWKSVLSGVKSAYNIEKLQESKITKLLKKKEDKGEP